MKLFIVVVMFVSVSIAFGNDVVWQVAPPFSLVPGRSLPKGIEASKVQVPHETKEQTAPKDDQEYSKLAPLNTNQKAAPDQRSDHDSKGDVNPHEKPSEWSDAVIIGTIIGVASLFFGYRQVFYAKKADRREEGTAATERMSRVTERAYMSIEEWRLEDLRDDESPRRVVFSLVNRGTAPATIIATFVNHYLEENLPLPFDALQGDLDTMLTGTKLYTNVPLILARWVSHGTASRKEIESRRKTLYAFVYVEYDDGFGQTQKESVFVKYSLTSGGWFFIRTGGEKYNYST